MHVILDPQLYDRELFLKRHPWRTSSTRTQAVVSTTACDIKKEEKKPSGLQTDV